MRRGHYRSFRAKEPFQGKCCKCEQEKEVRSIRMRTGIIGSKVIKFSKDSIDVCFECCAKMSRNTYKITELTPEELTAKVERTQREQKEISPVQSKPNRFNFNHRKAVHKSAAQGGQ